MLIFVSHASKDRAQAEALCNDLEQAGLPCWISSRNIGPGENYQEAIVAALNRCSAMVLLFTGSANQSPEIKKELALASVLQIQVIPVRLQDIAPTGAFQYELATRQWIDLFPHRAAALETLAASLRTPGAAAQEPAPAAAPRAAWGRRRLALLTACLLVLAGGGGGGLIWRAAQPGAVDQNRLFAASQLAANGQYDAAIKRYRQAIAADPRDLQARRQLIAVEVRALSAEAFHGDPALDAGLRPDYIQMAPVSDDEINAALLDIFDLQSRDATAKTDPALLLQQALILKTNGSRVKQAIPLLQQAHELAPADTRIMAELGLLQAVLPGQPATLEEGLALLRRAIAAHPKTARYHLYLGRALNAAYRCDEAGQDSKIEGEAQGCADAIRAYMQAATLAAADEHSIRRGAEISAMDIFHRYARKEHDILTPDLAMSPAERLRDIRLLIAANASVGQNGSGDDPLAWEGALERAIK